jgi:hypothetical protein
VVVRVLAFEAVPLKVAVIVPALKLPEESLKTMVPPVFAVDEVIVAEFA